MERFRCTSGEHGQQACIGSNVPGSHRAPGPLLCALRLSLHAWPASHALTSAVLHNPGHPTPTPFTPPASHPFHHLPSRFDAVGGVSVEANNDSVAELTGIDPGDILLAEWSNSTYRPCHYVAVDRANRCLVLSIRCGCGVGGGWGLSGGLKHQVHAKVAHLASMHGRGLQMSRRCPCAQQVSIIHSPLVQRVLGGGGPALGHGRASHGGQPGRPQRLGARSGSV